MDTRLNVDAIAKSRVVEQADAPVATKSVRAAELPISAFEGVARRPSVLSTPMSAGGESALPPRTSVELALASVGLAPEWTSLDRLPAELRAGLWVEIPLQEGGAPKRLSLEGYAAALDTGRVDTPLPPALRRDPASGRLEIDVHRFLAEALRSDPKHIAHETAKIQEAAAAAAAVRGAAPPEESVRGAATLTSPSAPVAEDGVGESDGEFSDGGGSESDGHASGDQDPDEPVALVGLDGEPEELLPQPPKTMEAALARVQLGSDSVVRSALRQGVVASSQASTSSGPQEVFLAAGVPVPVDEVRELLGIIAEDARSIGATSLASQAERVENQILQIANTDSLLALIDEGNLTVEQLISVVMLHSAQQYEEQLRDKMEEVVIAEQSEVKRSATEGLSDVVSTVFGESTEAWVAEIQAADAQLQADTPSQTVLMQELQFMTQQWQQVMELTSNLHKSLHDMAMTPIRNLR
ncbi:MAG: hypothetical protein AAF658_00515 [Myxococcota bacterium]